jgi:tripartite-type tricarboxylate transporter receptor subunit TctC
VKNNMPWSVTRRQALGALGALSLGPALADPGFPSRPIRLLLPFSAGSSTDFLSRTVAEQLAKQVGQGVVVENRPGAAGAIGTTQLARSAPDGYTIGLVSLASLCMSPPTMKEPPYDAVRDFAPLSALISTDLVLVAGPRAKGKTLQEFVDWARNQPKPPFLGTLGAGTSGHFAGFMFGEAAKIKFEPVHYKSFSELIPAMLSGDVDVMVVAPPGLLPHFREGRLHGLAMNGPTRLPAFPEVPTFLEAGYPTMQFMNWVGLAAPAKTPASILDKLSDEIIKATTVAPVRSKLEEAGFRVVASKRADFAAVIRQDAAVWRDMVHNSGFKL